MHRGIPVEVNTSLVRYIRILKITGAFQIPSNLLHSYPYVVSHQNMGSKIWGPVRIKALTRIWIGKWNMKSDWIRKSGGQSRSEVQ